MDERNVKRDNEFKAETLVTRMSNCYRSLQRAECQMKEKMYYTFLESWKILAGFFFFGVGELCLLIPFPLTQYGSVTAASTTAF